MKRFTYFFLASVLASSCLPSNDPVVNIGSTPTFTDFQFSARMKIPTASSSTVKPNLIDIKGGPYTLSNDSQGDPSSLTAVFPLPGNMTFGFVNSTAKFTISSAGDMPHGLIPTQKLHFSVFIQVTDLSISSATLSLKDPEFTINYDIAPFLTVTRYTGAPNDYIKISGLGPYGDFDKMNISIVLNVLP